MVYRHPSVLPIRKHVFRLSRLIRPWSQRWVGFVKSPLEGGHHGARKPRGYEPDGTERVLLDVSVLDPSGRLLMVAGTPGGPRIITMVYHVISNVIDHQMSLADAVAAPRMHHQALPDQIRVERGGFLPGTLANLRALGHEVVEGGTTGDVEAIIRTPDGWQGVSDPRYGGAGAGY